MKRIYSLLALLALLSYGSCQAKEEAGPDTPTPTPTPEPSTGITYSDFKIPSGEDSHGKALAFPGAEGAGMFTTGGRGGKIYHVTNLSDKGAGSLRYGIENCERPCTIVFDVSGIITLSAPLKIAKGDITIAGQSAPGDGICLRGYTLNIQASNVCVRFLRSRLGDETKTEDDAMNSYYGKEGAAIWNNIIIDHCSMSWSTDECGSFYGSHGFTLQWCILAESLTVSIHDKGAHGYGGIWGGQTASFHHNLLAHHSNRLPRLCGSRYSNRESEEKVELVNNVIYNWTGEGAYAGEGGSYNMIRNYYKPGPASAAKGTHCRFFTPYEDDGKNKQAAGVRGKFYLEGNYMDGSVETLTESQQKEVSNANTDNYSSTAFVPKSGNQADFIAGSKFDISYNGSSVTVQAVKSAFASVLKYSGASLRRDAVDSRVASEVENGTYTYSGCKGSPCGLIDTQTDVGGWPEYSASADEIKKMQDLDSDGMPDWFEEAAGLDKMSAADALTKTLDKYGRYTNIEMYLHYLIRDIIDAQNK